jgi:hypothetical protein
MATTICSKSYRPSSEWPSNDLQCEEEKDVLLWQSTSTDALVDGMTPYASSSESIRAFSSRVASDEWCRSDLDRVETTPGMSQWQSLKDTVSSVISTSLGCWSKLAGSSSSEPGLMAPEELHSCFDPTWVKPWNPDRFVQVRKLQDAPRNSGQVLLMKDKIDGCMVAVKRIPMACFGTSHTDFLARHREEVEHPWQDLGCSTFLSNVGYEHACNLHGVFQDAGFTYVTMSWATEGDLQTWCMEHQPYLGANAENLLRPLVLQLLESVAQLHGHFIVHGDLSLENVVITRDSVTGDQLKLIDFGMASSQRFQAKKGRGKSIYNAPEIFTPVEHDGFLADIFAVGIMVFAMTVGAYPWTSTKPGACQKFSYFHEHDLHAFLEYISKHDNISSATYLSEDLKSLLSGLLAVNPCERLTLGERVYGHWRRSVWHESWAKA